MADHIGLTLVTPPAAEPISLAEAKTFLRVDPDDVTQDTVLTNLIVSARQRCERATRRALVTQTWKLVLDRFPGWDAGGSPSPLASDPAAAGYGYLRYGLDADPRVVRLPRPPLQSISGVTYLDAAGVRQTLTAGNYTVDSASEPGRIAPAYGLPWPVSRIVLGAVEITYVAGYGSTVPGEIWSRLVACIAHLYEHRDDYDEDWLNGLFDSFRWDW